MTDYSVLVKRLRGNPVKIRDIKEAADVIEELLSYYNNEKILTAMLQERVQELECALTPFVVEAKDLELSNPYEPQLSNLSAIDFFRARQAMSVI